MKKLPIGISTFQDIITENYCYVDKSVHIRQLLDGGKYYFLSRPRRFGKSLFLDTLRSAFEGEKELFKGLYLENNWEWNDKYPVISISFGRGVLNGKEELHKRITAILKEQADKHDIKYSHELIADRFAELIQALYKKYGKKVVILVDEYDKPILDNIENISKAEEVRDGLKNFYSVIKDSDSHIAFCFITGVSKFSKVTIFSGLNNLEDISLAPWAGNIFGYTEPELVKTFESMLHGLDINSVREWYNGYNFLGSETVYNPFDILLFLKNRKFGNYWFETATPGFLVKLLKQKRFYIPDLEGMEVNSFVISSLSMEQMTTETI
ncbi:AAA family ATPase, partial [Desulfamplus magnetovallimortis]|uniref:ATP-binding protein n=1 Tax=Desulfamplus magnetovallimortis TaxID=1246637 RepID=UPI00164727E9